YAAAAFLLTFTIVGPVLLAFFGAYAILFVVDRNMSAIDAIKASAKLAMDNVGQTIVLLLMMWLLGALGGLACGVGTLATAPIAHLALAHYYRRLTGPATAQAPQFGRAEAACCIRETGQGAPVTTGEPQPTEGSATPPPGGYGQAPPPQGAYPGPEQGGFPPPPPPGPGPDGSYGPPGPGYGPPSDGEPQAVDSL